MIWRERLRALRALTGQRLRTLLTLLGIMIGSGAIVLVAGLVHGAEVALVAANQSVTGSDLVQIRAKDLPPRERRRGRPELSRGDSDALADSPIGQSRLAHSESTQEVRAQNGAKRKSARIVSGTPESIELFRLELSQGRYLDDVDMRAQKRVCVIGEEVWQDLFAGAPIGTTSTLRADNVVWSVVGVLAHKPLIGSTTGTNIWARKIIVPETTFDAVYPREHKVQRIVLLAERAGIDRVPVEVVRPAITGLLLRRHQNAQNFKLDDSKARDMERMIVRVVGLLLIASGILTLGTGAINVANVMFVSVSERTREIGLRRALGETRRSILLQFLLEAATLGLIGGTIGVAMGSAAVGLGGLGLMKVFPAFAARVEPWSIAAGFGLSVLAGLVAGLLPAMRAARLDPVVALRTE
ncbi:MAG TPA: ABC transporter permease [Polyangiaceae bacterium]|nr:ABC transporter permease [Polyangiaceae bacterium]